MKQKIVSQIKSTKDNWLLGPSGGASYLATQSPQCRNSGIQKDIDDGWLVKHVWEDGTIVVVLLEHP